MEDETSGHIYVRLVPHVPLHPWTPRAPAESAGNVPISPPSVDPDVLNHLNRAVDRSKRTSTVQLPLSFVRASKVGTAPPLAKLLRAGGVRLRLFLTFVMIATRAPHALPAPSAQLMALWVGLADPTAQDLRRVRDAVRWLERNGFLKRSTQSDASKPGFGRPQIVLLDPALAGAKWPGSGRGRYVTVPIRLWSDGWTIALSPRALTMYVVLSELTGGHPNGTYADGGRKRQYDLSDDTWTRGARELVAAGLIVTSWEREDPDFFEPTWRMRYRLLPVGD